MSKIPSKLVSSKLHRLNYISTLTNDEFRNHDEELPGSARSHPYCGIFDAEK